MYVIASMWIPFSCAMAHPNRTDQGAVSGPDRSQALIGGGAVRVRIICFPLASLAAFQRNSIQTRIYPDILYFDISATQSKCAESFMA